MKARVHTFQISVTFDKPCTAGRALREIKNDGDINADVHYCTYREAGDPQTFRVKSIKRMPTQTWGVAT